MYKSKHICDNNLVIDSWSVNDYQVKTGRYAEDSALRVSGRNQSGAQGSERACDTLIVNYETLLLELFYVSSVTISFPLGMRYDDAEDHSLLFRRS
jgi:hypothetical protein